jgi:hypothetical protein
MNQCHRLGIKNFKTIRHPRQIKLAFDLCTNDASARRYVSSKNDDNNNNQKIETFDLDYFTIKKLNNDWSEKYQYSKKILIHFTINTLYWIFRVLWIIIKYAICLIWCLFKIFRILTESKRYHSNTLICHPIRCYHHRL